METVAQRFERIRAERGLSLEAVAQNAAVALGTVRNFRAGKRDPKLSTAKKIARALGVTVDYLLGRSPDGEHVRLREGDLRGAVGSATYERIKTLVPKAEKLARQELGRRDSDEPEFLACFSRHLSALLAAEPEREGQQAPPPEPGERN